MVVVRIRAFMTVETGPASWLAQELAILRRMREMTYDTAILLNDRVVNRFSREFRHFGMAFGADVDDSTCQLHFIAKCVILVADEALLLGKRLVLEPAAELFEVF